MAEVEAQKQAQAHEDDKKLLR
jgi:hypothetical protein